MADGKAQQTRAGDDGAAGGNQDFHDEVHHNWDQCERNPGHESLIPVSEFTINHIPEPNRSDVLFNFILVMASLTARLTGKYISPRRPEEYVFSKFRGQKVSYMGSGYVINAYEDTDLSSQCLCPECSKSPSRVERRWTVILRTAAHVIYDSQEAAKTVVDLFYDNKHKREDMRTLYGIRVIKVDIHEDISEITCVTHDENTYERLKANLDDYSRLHRQLLKNRSLGSPNIEVIVSHPHGSSKQISFKETGTESMIFDSIPLMCLYGMKDLGLPGPALKIAVPTYGTQIGVVRSVKSPGNLKADGTEEAQMMNIEIKVTFPDGEISHHNIWMLKEPVRKSKEFLLRAGGIKDPASEFMMVLKIAQVEDIILDDERIMSDYIGELTEASGIHIKSKASSSSSSGDVVPNS